MAAIAGASQIKEVTTEKPEKPEKSEKTEKAPAPKRRRRAVSTGVITPE